MLKSTPSFAHILKANPYHDEKGRFSTNDKAKFVSVGGIFDRQRGMAASGGKAKPKADFKDRQNDKEFADEHMKKLDALSEEQRLSIYTYTGSNYTDINEHLRKGEKISESLKTTISNMDEAMSKASLGKDVIAYRGIQGGYSAKLRELHAEGKLIGATLEDKGFSSVTVSQKVAKAWSTTLNLEVKIPKTAKGFFVGHGRGLDDYYTRFDNEKEIVMNRGAKVKITGARKEGTHLILEGEWL